MGSRTTPASSPYPTWRRRQVVVGRAARSRRGGRTLRIARAWARLTGRSGREGEDLVGDLDTAYVLEQVAMSEGAITDDQHIGGLGHDRRSEVLGFTDRWLGDALHATGNGPVGRGKTSPRGHRRLR